MHQLKDRFKQWKADTQSRKSNGSKSSENSSTNTKPLPIVNAKPHLDLQQPNQKNNSRIGLKDNPPNLSISSSQDFPQDLWQCAYEKLGQEDPNALSILDNNKKYSLQTEVQEVIQVTEDRYKKYQQGSWRFQRSTGKDIVPREIARNIFNAAFSFKNVIGAGGIELDPAACAWAVVSLAMKVSRWH